MEPKTYLSLEGQELQLADVNALGDASAYADDRVLWELLRLNTLSPKAVLPYGRSADAGLNTTIGTVRGATADGHVTVNPCRVLVYLGGTAQIDVLRSMRSQYVVGASTQATSVAIAAGDPTNPRWTLVYAAVTPDAPAATVSRYVKDATTGNVAAQNLSVQKTTNVIIATVNGTAAASPTKPSIPADAGGTYYVPLAYIWVPANFGALSTVAAGQIMEAMPIAPIHRALGVPSIQPASSNAVVGGAVDTRQGPSFSTTRPGAALPTSMVGGEERVILLQLTSTPASHADGDIIDSSTDWRYRYFHWEAYVGAPGTSPLIASDKRAAGTLFLSGGEVPSAVGSVGTSGTAHARGFGQSFAQDLALGSAANNGIAVALTNSNVSNLGAGGSLQILVDATSGNLTIKFNGSVTGGEIFIWLRATARYPNWTDPA